MTLIDLLFLKELTLLLELTSATVIFVDLILYSNKGRLMRLYDSPYVYKKTCDIDVRTEDVDLEVLIAYSVPVVSIDFVEYSLRVVVALIALVVLNHFV